MASGSPHEQRRPKTALWLGGMCSVMAQLWLWWVCDFGLRKRVYDWLSPDPRAAIPPEAVPPFYLACLLGWIAGAAYCFRSYHKQGRCSGPYRGSTGPSR